MPLQRVMPLAASRIPLRCAIKRMFCGEAQTERSSQQPTNAHIAKPNCRLEPSSMAVCTARTTGGLSAIKADV